MGGCAMNDSFSFERFGKVLKMDFGNYVQSFGIRMLVLCLTPVALWIISILGKFPVDIEVRGSFMVTLIGLATILVPEKIYGHVNQPREGVGFAMLPATSSEKFFSMLVWCSLVTPLVCALGLYLVDTLLTVLPFGGFKEYVTFVLSKPYGLVDASLFASIFLLISSVFMYGNVCFKKRKTGKTILAVLVASFFMVCIGIDPFLGISVSGDRSIWFGCIIRFVLAVLFWYLTYRRIKNQTY